MGAELGEAEARTVYGVLAEKPVTVYTQAHFLERYRQTLAEYMAANNRTGEYGFEYRSRLIGRIEILQDVLDHFGLRGPMEIIRSEVERGNILPL